MPTQIFTGDIIEFVFNGLLHGQRVQNVLHYRVTDDNGVAPDLTNAILDISGALRQKMLDAMSNEYTLETYGGRVISPTPSAPVELPIFVNNTGGKAQNSLPSSTAIVLTKRTGLPGRSFRGRAYFCGIPVDQEIDSKVAEQNAGEWEILAAAMDDVIADGDATLEPVVWSRKNQVATTITKVDVRLILRNQRRRQVGVGN